VDEIFGSDSKLGEEDFRKKCALKKNNWLFNPHLLRKALAKKAKLDAEKW